MNMKDYGYFSKYVKIELRVYLYILFEIFWIFVENVFCLIISIYIYIVVMSLVD